MTTDSQVHHPAFRAAAGHRSRAMHLPENEEIKEIPTPQNENRDIVDTIDTESVVMHGRVKGFCKVSVLDLLLTALALWYVVSWLVTGRDPAGQALMARALPYTVLYSGLRILFSIHGINRYVEWSISVRVSCCAVIGIDQFRYNLEAIVQGSC